MECVEIWKYTRKNLAEARKKNEKTQQEIIEK